MLEYFSFVERANDRGDHVHQLEMLSFHVAREQLLADTPRILPKS